MNTKRISEEILVKCSVLFASKSISGRIRSGCRSLSQDTNDRNGGGAARGGYQATDDSSGLGLGSVGCCGTFLSGSDPLWMSKPVLRLDFALSFTL